MDGPKHILQLTKDEKRIFLDSFDLILNDCDGWYINTLSNIERFTSISSLISGVIWKFEGPLQGGRDGLNALKSLNKRIGFVTNNSYQSKELFESRFRDELQHQFNYQEDILHPAEATVTYLKSIDFQGMIYLIASDPFRAVLEAAGFQCIAMVNYIIFIKASAINQLFSIMQPNSNEVSTLNDIMDLIFKIPANSVKAVVYDVDLNFNLTKFYAAQYFLSSVPECLLIYGTDGKSFRCYDYEFAGVGVFMEALANQVKQKPTVMGKPSKKLGEMAIKKFKIKDRSRVLFIGDTLDQDIGFANSCGFTSLLVLSGSTSEKMFKLNSDVQLTPHYYADNIRDFVTLLKEE